MDRKLIASLSKKKYRDKHRLFVAEGLRFVSDIPDTVEIYMYATTDAFLSRQDFPFRRGVKLYICDDKAFKGLTDTVTPQGILAVCGQMEYDEKEALKGIKDDTFIIADNIKDPGNLGTIIRTAASASVKAVFLMGDTVDLYNPKVLRSTMGALFSVPVIKTDTRIFEALKNKGVEVIGTSPKAKAVYYDTNLAGNIAVVIGHESTGMSYEAAACCDRLVSVPVGKGCESLNAAVASAVIIYEALRQKRRCI